MRIVGTAALLCAVTAACLPRSRSMAEPESVHQLILAEQVNLLDTLAREPMLVEDISGALFVGGYNRRRPGLWKSTDRGHTWTRVDVGTAEQGAIGNSDLDLAIGPDGTLYFVTLTYDAAAGAGLQVAVGVSHDAGASWHWTTLSRVRFVDRPWVATSDGSVHVVWSDDRGVSHARTTDGGLTWLGTGRIHDRGGSSHLAIGPRDEIAVRISPGAAAGNKCDEDTDIIAVSADAGVTWRKYPAPGSPRPSGCQQHPTEIQRWVDPLAWSADGALNALWTDSAGVRLSRSVDRGATWTTSTIVPRRNSDSTPYFPYLTARGRTELGATWITGTEDGLQWHAAIIDARDASPPRVQESRPMYLDSRTGTPPRTDAGGEYLAARFLSDGTLGVVTAIQDKALGRLGFTLWRFRKQ